MSLMPKIGAVTEEIHGLDYKERLELFESEVESLYGFCLKKSFKENQLYDCVSGLRGPPASYTKKVLKDSKTSLLTLSVLVAVVAISLSSPVLYKHMIIHSKLFAIKFVLPFWNWAKLYDSMCLVDNPFLHEEEIPVSKEYCLYCTLMKNSTLSKFKNVPHDEMNGLIKDSEPIIITDATKDWDHKLTMDEIVELYQTNKFLSLSMGSCEYNSTVPVNETFYDLTTAYTDGTLPETWHFNWQNCDPKAAKVLRQYYRRPYFLPAMIQSSAYNMVALAMGSHPEKAFTFIDEQQPGMWFVLLEGSIKGKLTPVESCKEKFQCEDVDFVLNQGQALFFVADDWRLEYTPTTAGRTVGIASAVVWDR